MTGSTGRHGRPDEPDEPDHVASADEGMGITPTQPLPMVRRDGPQPEPQPVKAVAKRVASALPALGRDEISDLPPSARANADRRRRTRESAGEPEAESATPASPPAPGAPPSVIPRPRPEPEVERVPSAPVVAEVSPDVELVPVGSRSRETPAAPTSIAPVDPSAPVGGHSAPAPAPAAPRPGPTSGGAAGAPRQAPPPPPPLPPTTPRPGQPEDGPEPPEVIEATIVDDAPRPYASSEVQTDEWVSVPTAAPGPPAPVGPPAGPPPAERSAASRPRSLRRPAYVPAAPAPRPPAVQPGPPGTPRQPPPAPPLAAGHPDTWETTPLPPVTDDYEGRRRRGRRRGRRPALSGWLVVVGVVVALSAAVAVPFLFAGRGAAPDVEANPSTRTSGTVSTTPSVLSTGLPIIPAPSVSADSSASTTASATPTPTGSGGSTATTTAPATQTSTSNPPPALFLATLEAESGSRSGCAAERTVSGAMVVDRLGEANDWQNCAGHGTITFNNVDLPSGTFTVTIYYVFDERRDWDQWRYARLRLDPDGGGTNIDQGNWYPRTTNCCQTWTTAAFTVPAGRLDISFTNPGVPNGPDRAPALDRIVIQQTS